MASEYAKHREELLRSKLRENRELIAQLKFEEHRNDDMEKEIHRLEDQMKDIEDRMVVIKENRYDLTD